MIAMACTRSVRNANQIVNQHSHDAFLAMLPQIRRQPAIAFRGCQPEERDDLIQEAIAHAFVAFVRLVQDGRQDVAYATPLGIYAVRRVRSGRRIGSKRTSFDVMSPYAQVVRRIKVERLDQQHDHDESWREILLEDKKAGPAETAAARIDVPAWFSTLSARRRRIAKTLASGETTQETAKIYGISQGRISQLRRELQNSWVQFHSELAVA